MKTVLLTSILTIIFTLTILAQSQPSVLTNSGTGKFTLGKPFMGSMSDSLIKEKLKVRFPDKNLYFQDSKDKELQLGKPMGKNLMVQRGMPIYKPRESFSMPVYKPDSTIRFTMQIKKVERLSPTDFR